VSSGKKSANGVSESANGGGAKTPSVPQIHIEGAEKARELCSVGKGSEHKEIGQKGESISRGREETYGMDT